MAPNFHQQQQQPPPPQPYYYPQGQPQYIYPPGPQSPSQGPSSQVPHLQQEYPYTAAIQAPSHQLPGLYEQQQTMYQTDSPHPQASQDWVPMDVENQPMVSNATPTSAPNMELQVDPMLHNYGSWDESHNPDIASLQQVAYDIDQGIQALHMHSATQHQMQHAMPHAVDETYQHPDYGQVQPRSEPRQPYPETPQQHRSIAPYATYDDGLTAVTPPLSNGTSGQGQWQPPTMPSTPQGQLISQSPFGHSKHPNLMGMNVNTNTDQPFMGAFYNGPYCTPSRTSHTDTPMHDAASGPTSAPPEPFPEFLITQETPAQQAFPAREHALSAPAAPMENFHGQPPGQIAAANIGGWTQGLPNSYQDPTSPNLLQPPSANLTQNRRRGGTAPASIASAAPSNATNNSCSTCGRQCRDKADLEHHERNHIDKSKRPHKCSDCDSRFLFPKDLRRHYSAMHAPHRTIFCPVETCKYHTTGFSRRDHLARHLRNTHPSGAASVPPSSPAEM